MCERVIDKIAESKGDRERERMGVGKGRKKMETGSRKISPRFCPFLSLILFRLHFLIRFLANVLVFIIAQNNAAAAVAVDKNIRNYLCYYCDNDDGNSGDGDDDDNDNDHQPTTNG